MKEKCFLHLHVWSDRSDSEPSRQGDVVSAVVACREVLQPVWFVQAARDGPACAEDGVGQAHASFLP